MNNNPFNDLALNMSCLIRRELIFEIEVKALQESCVILPKTLGFRGPVPAAAVLLRL